MVMMLPFLSALISAWLAWRGHCRASLWWWLVTLAIFLIWCRFHMTSTLDISL
ncbi:MULTISPECIES: DUF5993 family protein [Microbulbifer]|uniref:Uncharacterized protein n=1 Tax=Microbulbifer rhizosphaerae TaxID=1562603 RepID=A0A7W4WDA5_9GAMM|nr:MULTISPECIES: DUF5993 family protein [Microbulbifer]MBB3061642.1 hypothetical protein [Microbulbifer rhizosphaerae]